MESFCLRTPPDPASSRTVAPFFNMHKHLFWHMFWLESVEQARVRTHVSGIPLPEAKLLGSVTTAAQASHFTLPMTFAQTWTYPLPQSEEQFPLTLLSPETHLSNTTNHVRPSRTIKAVLHNVHCCPQGTGPRDCLTHFV